MLPLLLVAMLAAPVDEPAGFRRRAAFIHVAPGILAFDAGAPSVRYYAWGVAAGAWLPFGRHGLVTVGGFFEHLVNGRRLAFRTSIDPGYFTDDSLVRLGPELRIGGSGQRVFGYGLARLGLDLWVSPERPHRIAPQFMASFGAGVQGLLVGHLILGFEPAVDVLAVADTRWLVRARVFVGYKF